MARKFFNEQLAEIDGMLNNGISKNKISKNLNIARFYLNRLIYKYNDQKIMNSINDKFGIKPKSEYEGLVQGKIDGSKPYLWFTSKYFGVVRHKNKWRAACYYNKQSHLISYRDDEVSAARDYDKYVKDHKLNKILNFP